MKKLLLIGVLILIVESAGFAMETEMRNSSYNIYNKTLLNNPELKKTWISLQEKNLKLEIELLNSSPNWEKVEKLNNDIAIEQAKFSTAEIIAKNTEIKNSSGSVDYNKVLINNPELKKSWVTLQEKKLELQVELLNTLPDWEKVEKLNNSIETERAKLRIAQAKYARGIQ